MSGLGTVPYLLLQSSCRTAAFTLNVHELRMFSIPRG